MRRALEARQAESVAFQTAETETLPAPTGGWNLVDPIAAMDPKFAILLDNWIPRPGYCEPRRGQDDWATGFGGHAVNSLIPYVGSTAKKLFAASNLGFYDITAAGAIGAAAYVISQSKGWISQQFASIATTYVSAVNGVDPAAKFDGATWTLQAITGVDPAILSYVTAYQGRLWFVEKQSLNAWYLAPGAIEGAATVFHLQTQARLGGHIVAIGTWSMDAGNGMSDYLVFVTSEGEAIIYQGVNPDVASSFSIVGTYRIPKPFGINPLLRYAGDLLILTQQGVYPASKALQNATIDKATAMTYKISPQFASDYALYGQNYGWQMTLLTEDNLLFVNAPAVENFTSNQYVMDTITGAWCRFRGVNATIMVDWNGVILYGGQNSGGQNVVGRLGFTLDDFGADIMTGMVTAYNYLQTPAANKHLKLVRSNLLVDAPIKMALAISTDFAPLTSYQYASMDLLLTLLSSTGIWDSGIWDQNLWGFAPFVPLQWRSVDSAPGFALAVGLQTSAKNAMIRLASFDLAFERGGIL